MKKVSIKNVISAFVVAIAAMGLASCSDWTTPESVDVNMPNTGDVSSATYQKYLESLRAYKQSAHKLVYVWYDNTHDEAVMNRSQHESALPDSIDFVVLMNPGNLANREVQEMDSVRIQKGTRTLLSVDFDAIQDAYASTLSVDSAMQPKVFTDTLTAHVNNTLALVDKYNYDGVVFKYDGMSTLHLDSAGVADLTTYQEAYLALVSSWHDSHTEKLLAFQGHPENLLDKSILASCKNIIVDCGNATSMNALAYDIDLTIMPGVPTDRYVALVYIPSLDTTDKTQGYFDTTNGVLAVPQAAIWVAQPSTGSYTKAGLGIYNVQNDFFNPTNTYSNTRAAINTLNPTPNI